MLRIFLVRFMIKLKPFLWAFCIAVSVFQMSFGYENKNVLGGDLEPCCFEPKTGFYRDGSCKTGPHDHGTHTVCAVMTEEFLEFTKARGNDLSTPNPMYRFPGLKAGDKWCLCAIRWREAFKNGVAPKVVLESTHQKTLEFLDLKDLQKNEL